MAISPESISITQNFLKQNGETLRREEVSPDELRSVLTLGRVAIVDGVEAFYQKQAAAIESKGYQAAVKRPSIFTLRLAIHADTEAKMSRYLTPYGLTNRTRLHQHPIEATDQSLPYWEAVSLAGFTPQLQSAVGGSRDIWLLLRNPETDPTPLTTLQHLPAALGFRELGDQTLNRRRLNESYATDEATYRDLLGAYFDEGERQVDANSDGRTRAMAQIGFIIASANLRFTIEGKKYESRYLSSLDDAYIYALNMNFIEVADAINAEIRLRENKAQ